MMSESSMVRTISKASSAQTGRLSDSRTIGSAISMVPPVESRAPPTGIMAPSRMITDQSMPS